MTFSKMKLRTCLDTGGDSGGYVFYNKGRYSDGWRYLEVAPSDIIIGTGETHIFGYYRNSPTGENLRVGTKASIGAGLTNTEALVFAMGDNAYISHDSSVTDTTTNYAAKLCSNLVVGEYNDWFLPSKAELNQMYQNLKVKGLGGFSDGYYWSSSEDFLWRKGWCQSFEDGRQSEQWVMDGFRVRPVRAF